VTDAVRWHDVECASYEADLPLWRALAEERGGPALDVGCGTGRVALDLAARGHEVTGLDADPGLVAAFAERARRRRLRVDAVTADARAFELGRRFSLAVAAMQVVQLLGGIAGRARFLSRVRAHLEPGGLLAAALADPFEGLPVEAALPPLPDILERDGWVLSSQPVAVRAAAGGTAIDRLRQAVSPGGELSESLVTISLDALVPGQLEDEGRAAGLVPRGRRLVPETPDHVGSTVVLLEEPRLKARPSRAGHGRPEADRPIQNAGPDAPRR
jgi:SAM-dependent methyltransferase